LRLGFYDERLREGIEMDSGLTFRKAGCKIMVQPDSVVCLYYPLRVRHAIDVEFYRWKWDIAEIMANFDYLKDKWNIDLGTAGGFKNYLVRVNGRVGPLSQMWPSELCVFLDRAIAYGIDSVRAPFRRLAWAMLAWRTGYYRVASLGQGIPGDRATVRNSLVVPRSVIKFGGRHYHGAQRKSAIRNFLAVKFRAPKDGGEWKRKS
jgi:hypothetical protein